ncbi:Qat anti-phage system TatD family nuclease QatD [Dyella terrae]|uniref:Qat anti-phage system TatD family nuclease QatD n=1 Tax=Dyella terrae TaxID=522259 RepID=UPI001EFC5A9C|nr:Qat anti-phage system TatD family nuclease QatD [Dyella terrae]
MHCHLDLYPDPRDQVANIARQKSYVLSVTTTPRAWRGTTELAAGHPRIKTALGLHPQLAKDRKSELSLFDKLLPEARYVGEVGLDGGPECRTFWHDQAEVFDHILASCVKAGGRILTLHSRAAAKDVLDALEKHPGYGVAVLHWFSGTQRELARASEMGCWFSVGSAMLRSQKGRTLAARMPSHRVLTETDGPFGMVAGKPLQPGECADAIKVLADLWDTDEAAARDKVASSFRELVSL